MPKILFVCLGNICRSPAAEGVMRSVADKAGLASRFEIASAGTIGMHAGELPDPRMRAAAERRGYRLTSRAQKFSAAHFAAYDLIVPMDETNQRDILALARSDEDRKKVRAFCSFLKRHTATAVPDPYYGGPEGFEHVLDLLEDGCSSILSENT